MNLIEPLVAGVNGAENGTAQLFVRGSTIRATYWTDFEGTNAITSGADVQLDVNGGAEVYVDVLTTVKVLDKAGTVTIREFVAGRSAPALEVRSPSFTGTAYVDASGVTVTGASQPTTAQAIYDLWKTQNGAIDWQVLVNGSSKTVQSAIAAFSGLFFNVKDPEFGAIGDGIADDLAAFNAAALAAQNANGGVVFIPPGTYRFTNKWIVPTKVSVLGVGPNASAITIDHATNGTIEFLGSVASTYRPFQTLEGVYFQAKVPNTGDVLRSENANLLVTNCVFGDGVNVDGMLVTTGALVTAGQLYIDACSFVSHADIESINIDIHTVLSHFSRCTFTPHTTMNVDVITMRGGTIERCTFINGGVTAGTFKNIGIGNSGLDGISVSGCSFRVSGGATVTAIHLGSVDARFAEAGNTFFTDNKVTGLATAAHRERVSLTSSRRGQETLAQSGGGVPVCDTDNFDVTVFEVSDTLDFDFDLGVALVGHTHTVYVHAAGGALANVDPAANTKGRTHSVSNNQYRGWHFVAFATTPGSAWAWQQVAVSVENL